MGRFASTAETYRRFREPYPAGFFALIAERLALDGHEALIDLGTGPGVLALGFHPYVGSILGVDPEPNMLAAAREDAAAAAIELPLIAGRTEDLAADIGRFDLITIGRALHWMDKATTAPVLDRILAANGVILICGASPVKDERNPWHQAFEAVNLAYSSRKTTGWDAVYASWFDGTPFVETEAIEHVFTSPISPEDLFERLLTRSSTSPAVLGDRLDACRADLMAALEPYFPDGARMETVKARANVYRRR
ncbi:Methyltransferase domain-containing protein [Kaistia soli DSM 19436]|uniref:Methyltransferase domain-containing protein n=1 Tax=Kaistia soli DSM 19436 TaxID=1122133 RepID=A0A1M4ZXU4_9HYPH|nr:class I SAM-dependent methyltransferase [Kaistia soli]SHF22870.1 Methyltransferase domain-containing protein [Kaistia soli DSM 19436]